MTQLFKAIDLDARMKDHAPSWNPGANAATFIVLTIVGRILNRLGGKVDTSALEVLALLLPLFAVLPLVAGQNVANLSYGDDRGRSNSSITAANIVTILLGLALWALLMIGLVVK